MVVRNLPQILTNSVILLVDYTSSLFWLVYQHELHKLRPRITWATEPGRDTNGFPRPRVSILSRGNLWMVHYIQVLFKNQLHLISPILKKLGVAWTQCTTKIRIKIRPVSLVVHNAIPLLIGPIIWAPITSTLHQVGAGTRLRPFPVAGNEYGRVTELKGDWFSSRNLRMVHLTHWRWKGIKTMTDFRPIACQWKRLKTLSVNNFSIKLDNR